LIKSFVDVQGTAVASAAAYTFVVHMFIVAPIVLLRGAFLWRSDVTFGHLLNRTISAPAVNRRST
jgi:hypothetical protein